MGFRRAKLTQSYKTALAKVNSLPELFCLWVNAVVIQYTELGNQPDIISSHMHELSFPDLEGVDGNMLRLMHTHITVPQKSVGHIQVKILGQSVAFRGGKTFENVISAGFYENSRGTTLVSLYTWMNLVVNNETGTSGLKRDYSKNGELKVNDTTGALVYKFKLYNMFPITVEMYELGEQTQAAEIQAQFSVDKIELLFQGGSDHKAAGSNTGSTRTNQVRLQSSENLGIQGFSPRTVSPTELLQMLGG